MLPQAEDSLNHSFPCWKVTWSITKGPHIKLKRCTESLIYVLDALAKPNISMSPRLVFRALIYYSRKLLKEIFHNLNPIQVAALTVVGHLPRPEAIVEERTVYVVKLVLCRKPQP